MKDLVFCLLIFILSFVLTLLVRKWAIRKSILDLPNDRSSHSIPTPRGGGVAIVVVWFLGLFYFYILKKADAKLIYALLSGFPIAVIGFLDDLTGLKANIRFTIQLISASTALCFLGGLQSVHFLSIYISNSILLSLFGVMAIVWFTNLFNFLDGIDGYIGTEVSFIGFAIFILTGDKIGLLLAFSSLGFLIWNWQKAKIFMGDVGSTLLGFSIAILTISHNNNNTSTIPVWLILTSVFWFDATVTLFRRIRNREKISTAHKQHAYQRLVQSGFSHQKTVLYALSVNLIGFGFAFMALRFSTYDWIFLILDVIVLFILLYYVDRRKPFLYAIKNTNS